MVADGCAPPVCQLGLPRGLNDRSRCFAAPTTTSVGTGPVTCRTRLGGVLNFYNREAA
jgi:hypothetical protein